MRVCLRSVFFVVIVLLGSANLYAQAGSSTHRPIGILSALPQEFDALTSEIKNQKVTQLGSDKFISGNLNELPVVVTLSGMGKVNAAIASQRLISEFQVKALIFTGVAGGIDRSLEIGDIVI